MDGNVVTTPLRSLIGGENARLLSISMSTLLFYEYFITLDDEVKYFWRGSWSASRILFFLNRYLTPALNILTILCFSTQNPTGDFCRSAIKACFFLNVLGLAVIQAILVLRVYYLFSNSQPIRWIVIASFLASIAISMFFAYDSVKRLTLLEPLPKFGIFGCRASRPRHFWRIFLPPLVLHSLLFFLTVLRALTSKDLLKSSPVVKRLVRDGGLFYFITFVSVGYTAIAAFLEDTPEINIPAIYSNFVLTLTSISVSRVMLSIQSLAAKLGFDSAWLLNNLDLSRVRWRYGEREGELVVDIDSAYENDRSVYDEVELSEVDLKSDLPFALPPLYIRNQRVGTFEMSSRSLESKSLWY